MGKVLKWIGIVIGVLVGLIIVAVAAVYIISGARMAKTYNVQPETIAIPTDAASIERGRHLATAVGKCVDCHGENLGGSAFIDDPALGRVVAVNLTSGKGGIGGAFTDADFVRAIRHGVRPDGKSVIFMPAQEFYNFSDADLGAIIAYIKSVPPVDNTPPKTTVRVLGRVLLLAGKIELLPAELIDQSAARPTAPHEGVTADYGQYLVATGGCKGCHNPSLSGGPVTGAPPSAPPAANLTPGGELAGWSETDFMNALRTGVTVSGRHLDAFMPWKYAGQMTDDEIAAVWMYLQTVPAKQTGER